MIKKICSCICETLLKNKKYEYIIDELMEVSIESVKQNLKNHQLNLNDQLNELLIQDKVLDIKSACLILTINLKLFLIYQIKSKHNAYYILVILIYVYKLENEVIREIVDIGIKLIRYDNREIRHISISLLLKLSIEILSKNGND